MYPVYRCMDSYPHQRNQMPCSHPYHPSFEGVPFQMKVDPARSPVPYESWPYGRNYGYSIPVGCNGCCNHNYFPGNYSFRPPYPHSPPPSPFHYHGSYPTLLDTYPVHYTPHYSMEQPRYEYDKNGPRDDHCCGCPNHLCNRREDPNVKIEEQEPNVERKSSDSLVPIEFKNYPYPVVWIPPGYMKNKEHREPIVSEPKERDEYPHDTKAHGDLKSSEQEPSDWNRWFPLDMNSLGSLKHDGDGKGTQNQQNEDKSRFPFPIFWMPYKPDEVERKDHKETNTAQESVEESPSDFWVTPVKLLGSDDRMSQPRASEENSGSDVASKMMEKNANQKLIPVKQLVQHEEKRTPEDTKGKARGIPVKHIEDNQEKTPSENSTKRQSSSPTKASKLPPVCLRLDPLPRRKNGNTSSRSPSPSAHKRSQELSSDSSNSSTSSSLKESNQQDMQRTNSTPNKIKEVEPNRNDIKVIEVVEGTKQDRKEDCKAHTQTQVPVNFPADPHEEVSTNQTPSKAGIDYGVCNVEEGKGARDKEEKKSREAIESKDATVKGQSGDGESEIGEYEGASKVKEEHSGEAVKAKRKNVSEAEAAVIIQSAYRGFEVRKWETLKKLKQIIQVREQVTGIRSCIQALEFSSDTQSDDRQKVILGETIMGLLLKLDTIQGLHPSVRDIRKSVAKELVSLQEKFDFLTIKKSEVSAAKPVDDLSTSTGDDVCIQGQQMEAEDVGLKDTESDHDKSDSVEPCQGHPFGMVDAISGSQAVGTSDFMLVDKEAQGEFEDKITDFPVARGVNSNKAQSDPFMKPKDEENNEVLDVGQVLMSEMQEENHDESEIERSVELPLPPVAEEKTDSVVEKTNSAMGEDPEMNQLVELPLRGLNEEPAVEESLKNEQIETGTNEVSPGREVESTVSIDAIQPDDEVGNTNKVEQQPLDTLMEGPVIVELEDKIGSDKDEELLVQAQGKEVGHIDELAEVFKAEENKVGSKEADELLGGAKLEIGELIMQPQEEVSNIDELVEASKPEEPKPEFSFVANEIHGGEQEDCHGIIDADDNSLESEVSKPKESQPELSSVENEIHDGEHKEDHGITDADDNSSGSKHTIVVYQEKDAPIEETKECSVDPEIGEEVQELPEERLESKELESITGNDRLSEQRCGPETAEEEVAKFTPSNAERAEEGGELSPMSPTVRQVSVGTDIGLESDRKLIEENKRMREMMEKLIEAGKEQLTAISNLTGRVKDLEKKLSRKKRLKTRRFRAATSGSCCVEPSNDSLKGRAVGFAM